MVKLGSKHPFVTLTNFSSVCCRPSPFLGIDPPVPPLNVPTKFKVFINSTLKTPDNKQVCSNPISIQPNINGDQYIIVDIVSNTNSELFSVDLEGKNPKFIKKINNIDSYIFLSFCLNNDNSGYVCTFFKSTDQVTGTSRIYECDENFSNFNKVKEFPTSYGIIFGICQTTDNTGYLYTLTYNNKIIKINNYYEYVSTFMDLSSKLTNGNQAIKNPWGISKTLNGEYLICNGGSNFNNIIKVDYNGKNGLIFVNKNAKVKVNNIIQPVIFSIPPPNFSPPFSIIETFDGSVLITNILLKIIIKGSSS